MSKKKTDLAIINRSFWPKSQTIGEGLLQFAEKAALENTVCIITQSSDDIATSFLKKGRGKGVQVRACKSYTASSSSLIRRMSEAIYFMTWTFISLIQVKPANVYVSTNPPVIVPFIVAVYCRIFKANYVYHLQDIHPEAANIVVPLNKLIFRALQVVDNYTLRHAKSIITLSDEMKNFLQLRSSTDKPIYIVDNPSIEITPSTIKTRKKGVVFCGNAGRLQRIPLLINAIDDYIQKGGQLYFSFAGGGVYTSDIETLADNYEQVDYLGIISATEAAELVNNHLWALLPIDDEVTKYAFPSKSSGYALSNTRILAICGKETSVARWVIEHDLGVVCEPDHESLVQCFFSLEHKYDELSFSPNFEKKRLSFSFFSQRLYEINLNKPN